MQEIFLTYVSDTEWDNVVPKFSSPASNMKDEMNEIPVSESKE